MEMLCEETFCESHRKYVVQETFCGRKHFLKKMFCGRNCLVSKHFVGKNIVKEMLCGGNILWWNCSVMKRLVGSHFGKETFSVETFCKCFCKVCIIDNICRILSQLPAIEYSSTKLFSFRTFSKLNSLTLYLFAYLCLIGGGGCSVLLEFGLEKVVQTLFLEVDVLGRF